MKRKVLVVDDDQYIRNSLSAILNSEDYIVSVAEDKITALHELKKSRPDVMLLDVNMNEKQEGYDLANELLQSNEYNDIPVIMLTSTEIVSGNDKILDLARKFRNNPQFDYINAILREDNKGKKILEYKSDKNGEIIQLPVYDALSKPIDTNLLLDTLRNLF